MQYRRCPIAQSKLIPVEKVRLDDGTAAAMFKTLSVVADPEASGRVGGDGSRVRDDFSAEPAVYSVSILA